MNSQNLYDKLRQTYTESNLNKITSHIIKLYRNEHSQNILKLGILLKDFIDFDISKANRLFNHLMMLYHPDKLNYYLAMIDKYQNQKDQEKLSQFSHIFIVQKALKIIPVDHNFDYSELYSSEIRYGLDEEDFDTVSYFDFSNNESEIENDNNSNNDFIDFITAMQRREKINLNINSLDFYLEQFEGELDLSNSNLYELSGIEHCKNISSLDLSHNIIIDISNIRELVFLKSIYLSSNNISDISALAEINTLEYIDLSFNDITNLEPLSGLSNVKYLNIIGNEIPQQQIKEFPKDGVIFIY